MVVAYAVAELFILIESGDFAIFVQARDVFWNNVHSACFKLTLERSRVIWTAAAALCHSRPAADIPFSRQVADDRLLRRAKSLYPPPSHSAVKFIVCKITPVPLISFGNGGAIVVNLKTRSRFLWHFPPPESAFIKLRPWQNLEYYLFLPKINMAQG